MKQKSLFIVSAFLIGATTVFGANNTSKSVLDKMDVVAVQTKVDNSTVISCNINSLKETIEIPLNEFVESLHIVKLDKRDDALVDGSNTTVTDNYIMVRNKKQNPYKLFDKKGKFITTIGSYGQGPGEYMNVYDDFLDEKNKRIYILPWQTDKLLVYDLTGKALTPIPLPYRVPKGVFSVNSAKSTISVALLPFAGMPSVAWSQDFKGNILGSVKSGNLSVKPDFSNEVYSGNNTSGFDFSLFTFFELRPDTLYHYNGGNQLTPKFTLDFKKKPIKIHWYEELPNHFIGNVTVEVQLSENLSTTEKPAKFIVDKRTLKGAFYTIYNNFLGNMPIDWATFQNGYYVWNVEPGTLMDQISKQLKEKNISEKQRQNMTKILSGIDENDNNYIVYGKLKK